MPQIKVFLNPLALNMITADKFPDLSVRLTNAIENVFGIAGKEDVAVDFFSVLFTKNEAPVQIEVPYTAGRDEYHIGRIFDPSEPEREEAAKRIHTCFEAFLAKHSIGTIVPSVWILPQYHSTFRVGVVQD